MNYSPPKSWFYLKKQRARRADPYAGLTLLSSFPNDISNAYWGKKEGSVTSGVADARGGAEAERFLETTTNDTHEVSKNGVLDLVSGVQYVMEAVVKSVGGRHMQFQLYDNTYASGYGFNFNLMTGAVGSLTVGYGTIVSGPVASIMPAGGGYYRCRLQFTAPASFTDANFFWTVQTGPASSGGYAGDITKGLDFDSLGLYRLPL